MKQDEEGIEFRKICEFADFANKDVLEVGCGNGRVSAMIGGKARTLVAIDPNLAQLEIARSSIPGVDFRAGSGEDLDFSDGDFDIVAFTFSLHHQDGLKALEEAHRVLRPAGQLLIIEPSVEGEVHKFFNMFRDEDREIAGALRAIRASRFHIEREETFATKLVFDDNEDVYDYYFNHYNMKKEEEFIGKMNRLLGEKISHSPIVLEEVVTLFSLRKI